MDVLSTRTLAATAVALLTAVAVVAGPAAAAVDVLAPGTTDDGGNSSLTTDVRVGSDGGGGNWTMTCAGSPSGAQGCDKAGDLEAGPLAIDYEGDNHANLSDRRGGGGDEITLDAAGQNTTVGFECEFESTAPSADTCPVEATTPGGGSVPGVT